MTKYDTMKLTEKCINWIKKYFIENANENTKAIIGISGGKDSAVAAALCVAALGKDRVIGVKLPQGEQKDIDCANKVIDWLGIYSIEINIADACEACYKALDTSISKVKEVPQITSNLPARIRMTMLYAIAAFFGGRVVNTCNYSEDYVGYATKFGDGAGDFSPLGMLTTDEVIEIGKKLEVPLDILFKNPEDGLSGLTDEQNLGFSYKTLNDYIRHNIVPDIDTLFNIETRHKRNIHKVEPVPVFNPASF
ncbi:MAG: NAD(+) synthase [Lachnospiraceae bacterium]|nr:NAD(+) synthase [Lachnospiraceae bacterium]